MRRPGLTTVAAALLLTALVLAGVVSRFADSAPDGLTKVSQDHGFADTEKAQHTAVLEYGSLSGVVGVLVVLAVAGGLTYAVRRRRPADERG